MGLLISSQPQHRLLFETEISAKDRREDPDLIRRQQRFSATQRIAARDVFSTTKRRRGNRGKVGRCQAADESSARNP